MLKINYLFIALLNSLIFSHGVAPDEKVLERKYGKLIHVSVIFRHGDRAPYSTYPRDPYKSYPWPDGLGQLLKPGKLRMYNIGKWFREQYQGLLKTIHSHTQMLVESSDVDRTIASAQYFMASFYTPNETQRILTNFPWQAIPIHTTSINENYITMSAPCPRSKYYSNKFFRTTPMEKKYDQHKETFDYLRRHSGFKFSRNELFFASNAIEIITDSLGIQKSYNLTLPSWTKKVYPGTLNKLNEFFQFRDFSNSKVLPFKAGPIMKSIIADLMLAKNETNYSRKVFHFYSGHDTTIVAVMNALGNYNGKVPPYGSALMLELRTKGKDSFVLARYKNSQNSTIQELNIPKCGKFCTVEKFVKMTRPVMIKNWKQECRLEN